MRYLLICLIFITVTSACKKPVDFTPTMHLKGDGYAIDYYKHIPVPDLTISVTEEARQGEDYNESYDVTTRGNFKIDSNGHFNFDIKVFSITSSFTFQTVYPLNYNCQGPQIFNTDSTNHFNLEILPAAQTWLTVPDSDMGKLDSMRIENPYYKENIISWNETIIEPGFPPPHLYPNPLKVWVMPNSNDTIRWTYYKSGHSNPGKDMVYHQGPLGVNANLTLAF